MHSGRLLCVARLPIPCHAILYARVHNGHAYERMVEHLLPRLDITMVGTGSRCDTSLMLVKPDAYERLYETFLREQASTLERNVVIFSATTSCDAVCATKILMVRTEAAT